VRGGAVGHRLALPHALFPAHLHTVRQSIRAVASPA
jgi:hypothetical protein